MPEILIGPTLAQTAQALAAWGRGILALAPASTDAAELARAINGDLPDEPFAIMQTSGSTGRGKLVVIPKNALAYSARATNEALGGPGNWVCCLPTHHIAGFQTVARPTLTGHRLFDAGRGTPQEIAACARNLPAAERTYLSLVPTQLTRLLESPAATAARSFAAILVGGAGTPSETLKKGTSLGLNLVTTYGMTETCGGCAYNGAPIGDTHITTGSHGRITITGSVVAHGYLGSEPFAGTFTTNDSGTLHNGIVQITGRLDRAITTGGLTVLPEPIEAELERLGAGGSVVIGIPDTHWGERFVAVTLHPLQSPKKQLKPLLEAVPQEFLTVADLGIEALPLLESGKPNRTLIAELVSKRDQTNH